MAAIQKVVLLQSSNSFRARPAYVVAEPGDKIRFLNFTGATVNLSFPDDLFSSKTIVANGGWDATVPADALAGPHVYRGDVGGGSNNLDGESSPEIIIDRFSVAQA